MSREIEDAYIRLLDMLAGWEHYTRTLPDMTDNDADVDDIDLVRSKLEKTADHIHDLYQAVGSWEDYTEIQIENFILNSIMPLVLKGKSDSNE